MRQLTFTLPASGSLRYPNSIAFIYSRQPLIIEADTKTAYKAQVTVTCSTNGDKSHTEIRYLRAGYAEFDLAAIFRATARDVDEILQRLDYEGGQACLAEVFSVVVTLGNTTILSLTNEIQGLYGSLDAGEVYGGTSSVRHFINYPQSLNVWKDVLGSFTSDRASSLPFSGSEPARCREVNLSTLTGGTVLSGPLTTSWLYRIQEGKQTQQATRTVNIIPDNAPFGEGAFLRWLNRRGEVSYWHFDKTELETSAGVSESFSRHYSADPAEPQKGGVYINPEKRNYAEARKLGLVTHTLSEEEFDNLISLLSSPVVEMLYVAPEYRSLGLRFDGGTAQIVEPQAAVGTDAQGGNTVDGGRAAEQSLYTPSELRWLRVNVDGSNQSRYTRRNTPRLHDFAVTISLIERNTVKI